MKRLLIILSVSVLLSSCDKNAELREVMEDSTIRLSIQGVTQFAYNPTCCQIGFCREKKEFRVHTDNMSDYFVVTLDRIPAVLNSTVTGNIIWTGSSSLERRENIALEVVKLEGDKIWLWNGQARIAAVLKVLE